MKKPQSGLTLIEVLVTIVILSIGMLGLAGLQAATTKYKINSWARSATAMLFSDFSDRVRGNPDAGGGQFFGGATATSPYAQSDTWAKQQADKLNKPDTDCMAGTCTPAQQAAYDMWSWRSEVRRLLPQGGTFVEGNRVNGFTVTLMWFDKNNVDTADPPALIAPKACNGKETGAAFQSCCPQAAAVPAGGRCLRMSMVP